METERLIEPCGLVYGPEAVRAVKAGVALPLAGGPVAFTLVTLIEHDRMSDPLPVGQVPSSWREKLDVITSKPSSAGLPAKPQVMGILNVTPDSFSDGGQYQLLSKARALADSLLQGGAGSLVLGSDSTRPGSVPVTPEEEWGRLQPVLAALVSQGACISVDTRNASTMEKALDAGAFFINDVTALTHDPEAIPFLAGRECPVVLMHMRGTPQTMSRLTNYRDVAVDVVRELAGRIGEAERHGIRRERLLIDPGIGFAKTEEQSAELLRRLPLFANLGCRMVLGTSRKRMIGTFSGEKIAKERDPGTIASSLPGLALSDTILRVHNSAAMTQAMRVWQHCFGIP